MTDPISVRLVTAAHLPDLAPDDQELLHALRRLDVPTEVVVWDDPDVDWAAAPVTVVRSVFGYHLRYEEFMAWLGRIEPHTTVFNEPETIRWNAHKSYLRAVEEAGFPSIPTEWVERGGTADLAKVMESRGWTRAIVKPAVSASADGTLLVDLDTLDEGQAHLNGLAQHHGGLIQPYLEDFTTTGESSLIWLGGGYSHAVRRPSGMHTSLEVAHQGQPLTPDQEEMALASAVFDWIKPQPLYVRIDLLDTEQFGLLVLELELIEPALYLRHDRAYADRFAAGVKALVDGQGRG